MIAIAGILFNSYLGVESMRDSRTYWLDPLDTEPEFEDSEVFHNILSTAVSDILQYVVLQEELETNGVFDAGKKIDITKYAGYRGMDDNCGVTAVYRLEDLIKWGKHGVDYTTRTMSMSDFVNYFGPATSEMNFALDEDGRLYFAGFRDSDFTPEKTYGVDDSLDEAGAAEGKPSPAMTEAERRKLKEVMEGYTTEQLEDMAFIYILNNATEEINVSREDDGSITVYVPMLSCRYGTVDGERQLSAYAGSWSDYLRLQKYLAAAIESFTDGYEMYQKGQELYGEGRGNLEYAVRMVTEDGITRTYTNVPELALLSDDEITEYTSEFRRYFVYFLDKLEFAGITRMSEGELYQFINEYGYGYPEKSHIWMAVDTKYPVEGDAFYDANAVFGRIVPNIVKIIAIIAVFVLVWLAVWGYLTVTAGVAYDEEGERVYYLGGIDFIWTEILFLLAAAAVYAASEGIHVLEGVANTVYSTHSELLGMTQTKLYEYGTFGLFGALASLCANTIWFSLLRRVHAGSLWKNSFGHWLLLRIWQGINYIFTHRNTAVSILLPYNLFLLLNLAGAFLVSVFRESHPVQAALILLGVVLADGLVGVLLFRHGAEQADIVEGIRRIRGGEVDYKLDADSLGGMNREMADAVNNIGEGISRAVQTSMKDEQMKSDLITNVSHDIKTPLTSIVNYVDLLKRLQIQDEPARDYIEILDSKAQRLKQLTDDLVEASKISSGNIVLNMERLNLTELLNQSIGEFSEKLEERKLQVIFEDSSLPAFIYGDSRRMWRVVENLFNNICKYALDNTRVYLDLLVEEQRVELSVKNISERQMNMRGDELTERFIRGDAARTTEGSGLGLFIAKSLTQAQGGIFEIQLDGDLFKVILCFPECGEK